MREERTKEIKEREAYIFLRIQPVMEYEKTIALHVPFILPLIHMGDKKKQPENILQTHYFLLSLSLSLSLSPVYYTDLTLPTILRV